MKKALFFSPYQFFSVHAEPEVLIAESLQLEGYETVFVTCKGILAKNCLCMSVVPFEDTTHRERICRECRENRNFLMKRFKRKQIFLDNLVNCDEKKNIEDNIGKWENDDLANYTFQGIQIGKKTLYEFILKYKLLSDAIPNERLQEFRFNLYNTTVVATAMERVLGELRPDIVVFYNFFYSTNQVVAEIAHKSKTSVFSLHAGTHHQNRDRIVALSKVQKTGTLQEALAGKPTENSPLNPASMPLIEDHIQGIFEARTVWVYSPKTTRVSSWLIRKKISLPPRSKVVLAALRSDDERSAADLSLGPVSARNPLFQDQFSWLDWLAEFSETHPEITVVVRQHPREAPNRREQVISANHHRLNQWLSRRKVPKNMIFNRPDQKISLYDLFKITDLVLRNSSSVGVEAALYGIPVVGMGDDTAFDPLLQKESRTLAEYEKNILQALQLGWNLNQVYLAYRWYSYLFGRKEIDLRDGWRSSQNFFFRLQKKLAKGWARVQGLPFVDSSYCLKVLRKPLVNHYRLMKILLEQTPHGSKATEPHPKHCPQLLLKAVRESYQKTMGWLSENNDPEFQERIKKVLSQELSLEDSLNL